MPRRERATPRKLVRWDNETDILCFLAIPRIMARRGIKFPWGEVAAYVGDHVTGNALLQHMAKLTRKRVEMGQSVPETVEPVGSPANFSMIAAAGFGDRRNAQLTVLKPSKAGTPVFSDDTGDSENGDTSSKPQKSKNVNKPAAGRGFGTPKARTVRKKATSIKPEAISDDEFSTPAAMPSQARPARHAAKRGREALSASAHYSDADFDGDGDFALNQSPKKIKIDSHSASSDYDESQVSSKIVSLSFIDRKAQFIHQAHEWGRSQNSGTTEHIPAHNSYSIPSLNLGISGPSTSPLRREQEQDFMDMDMFGTEFDDQGQLQQTEHHKFVGPISHIDEAASFEIPLLQNSTFQNFDDGNDFVKNEPIFALNDNFQLPFNNLGFAVGGNDEDLFR